MRAILKSELVRQPARTLRGDVWFSLMDQSLSGFRTRKCRWNVSLGHRLIKQGRLQPSTARLAIRSYVQRMVHIGAKPPKGRVSVAPQDVLAVKPDELDIPALAVSCDTGVVLIEGYDRLVARYLKGMVDMPVALISQDQARAIEKKDDD